MTIMPVQSQLTEYLRATLSPDSQQRKQAETYLRETESDPKFTSELLSIVENNQIFDENVRSTAAVYLKNLVKAHWNPESTFQLSESDRLLIKQHLVNLMISTPPRIQAQMSEVLAAVAECDFPAKWPNLVKELVSRLSQNDFNINNAVLSAMHVIFKKYRHQLRSDELYSQINLVLGDACQPLLQLWQFTDACLLGSVGDIAVTKSYGKTVLLLCKVFYSLSSQDLPPYFEENLATYMGFFQKYLTLSNRHLEAGEGDSEPGILEKTKTVVCDILDLYQQRYADAFGNEDITKFASSIAAVLFSCSSDCSSDSFVCAALRFLRTFAKQPSHIGFFNAGVLEDICLRIVLPNMGFRDSDEELFEDNPSDYLRRDMEGLDMDTRRKAASDLVRTLNIHFEPAMTQILGTQLVKMMNEYANNKSENWRQKDTALYILTSVAIKSSTNARGATSINSLVNVEQFFMEHVLADLQSTSVAHPVLKADSIKYIYMFRSHLSREILAVVFPLLTNELSSSSFVVYSYAAITIERLLSLRTLDNSFVFNWSENQTHYSPYALSTFEKLFSKILGSASSQKIAENEHLMKAVLRIIIVSKSFIRQHVEFVLTQLKSLLRIVSENPSNPIFNHYLFESISALVRYVGSGNPGAVGVFEEQLLPLFQHVLHVNVVEFTPYVFQILSQLLELHSVPDHPSNQFYRSLLPFLLLPSVWEMKGNIPALTRLLEAYLVKYPTQLEERYMELLGIYDFLMKMKNLEEFAFNLLDSLFETIPSDVWLPHLRSIFTIQLNRLTHHQSPSLCTSFTKSFCHLLLVLKDPVIVIKELNAMKPGLLWELLNSFMFRAALNVKRPIDRKQVAIAFINLITQCPEITPKVNETLWISILDTSILLLESAPAHLAAEDIEEEKQFEPEYQVSFANLALAGRTPVDYADIEYVRKIALDGNPRKYVVIRMSEWSGHNPGTLSRLELSSITRHALSQYATDANVLLQ